jgi:hypothetical protein
MTACGMVLRAPGPEKDIASQPGTEKGSCMMAGNMSGFAT